jgi:hypothetical protein
MLVELVFARGRYHPASGEAAQKVIHARQGTSLTSQKAE